MPLPLLHLHQSYYLNSGKNCSVVLDSDIWREQFREYCWNSTITFRGKVKASPIFFLVCPSIHPMMCNHTCLVWLHATNKHFIVSQKIAW